MKQVVYCSLSFLDSLYERIDRPIADWIDEEAIDATRNLYRFLHSPEVTLFVDGDIVAKMHHNPNYRKLIKQAKISRYTDEFNDIYNNKPKFFSTIKEANALFFVGSARDVEEIEGYGQMAFTPDEIENTSFLFSYSVEPFKKGKANSWNFALRYKHPFNSLVIADGYLLCEKRGVDNLCSLLNQLLPERLNIPADITVITNRDDKGRPGSLDSVYKNILKQLSDKPYDVNLSIVIGKIHDRNLITNYLVCSSGYGFELIDGSSGESIRDTHMSIISITSHNQKHRGYKGNLAEEKSSILALVSELKERYCHVVKSTPNQVGLLECVVGTRQNRLLD